MKEGDIILLHNEELAKIVRLDFPSKGTVQMERMSIDEYAFWSASDVKLVSNLGQSSTVLAVYHAARSIHVRLNRMAKL